MFNNIKLFLTKKYTVPTGVAAFGKGVIHALLIFLIGFLIFSPFSFYMWSASDILIFSLMIGIYFASTFAATHLLRDWWQEKSTTISVLGSSTSVGIIVVFIIYDVVKTETLPSLVTYESFTFLLLGLLPIFHYFYVTYLLDTPKFNFFT